MIVAVNMGNNEYALHFGGEIYELISGKKKKDKAVVAPYSFGVYYTEKI